MTNAHQQDKDEAPLPYRDAEIPDWIKAKIKKAEAETAVQTALARKRLWETYWLYAVIAVLAGMSANMWHKLNTRNLLVEGLGRLVNERNDEIRRWGAEDARKNERIRALNAQVEALGDNVLLLGERHSRLHDLLLNEMHAQYPERVNTRPVSYGFDQPVVFWLDTGEEWTPMGQRQPATTPPWIVDWSADAPSCPARAMIEFYRRLGLGIEARNGSTLCPGATRRPTSSHVTLAASGDPRRFDRVRVGSALRQTICPGVVGAPVITDPQPEIDALRARLARVDRDLSSLR